MHLHLTPSLVVAQLLPSKPLCVMCVATAFALVAVQHRIDLHNLCYSHKSGNLIFLAWSVGSDIMPDIIIPEGSWSVGLVAANSSVRPAY